MKKLLVVLFLLVPFSSHAVSLADDARAVTSTRSSLTYENDGSLLVVCAYTLSQNTPSAWYAGRPLTRLGTVPFPGGNYAGVSLFAQNQPRKGTYPLQVSEEGFLGLGALSYGTETTIPTESATDLFDTPNDSHTLTLPGGRGEFVVGCHANSNSTVGYHSLAPGVVRAAFGDIGGIMFDSGGILEAPGYKSTLSWEGSGSGGAVLASFCELTADTDRPRCSPRQGSRSDPQSVQQPRP